MLTLADVELAAQFVADHPSATFRLAFNSLRAGASINHLHLHAYDLPPEGAPLEKSPTKILYNIDNVQISKVTNYPAKTLLFSSVNPLATAMVVFSYIKYLQDSEKGHCVIFSPNGIYVMLVINNHTNSFGNTWTFYELAGFILTFDELNTTKLIKERDIVEEMERITIDDEFFEDLSSFSNLCSSVATNFSA